MPLPRLPDISLDSWIRDQQQQFERTISSIGEAFEFKDAVSDVESSIPPDFDAPGGRDQWEELQRQNQEEEYRRLQEEDERRRQQAEAEENIRQREAYLNEKMKLEEQQRLQDQLLNETRSAGLQSPDQMASEFQAIEENRGPVGDFQNFASQIEAGQPPDFLMKQPQEEEPPLPTPPAASPASQGGSDLESITAQIESGTYQPEEPSLEALTAQLESQQPGVLERAWEASAPRAYRPGTEEYEKFERQRGRFEQSAPGIKEVGQGWTEANRAMSAAAEVAGNPLGLPARVVGEAVGTPTVEQLIPGTRNIPVIGEDLGTSNVTEVASAILPLPGRAGKLQAGLSGVAEAVQPVARAANEALQEGAQAIRTMISQGMDDDLVRRAEISLVEKYDVTPSQVRALTREVEPAAPTGQVLNRATQEDLPTTLPDLDQPALPGFEPPKPPPIPRAERNQRTVDTMMEEAAEEYQLGRERFSLEDIDRQAEAIIGRPNTMRELAQQALERPGDQASIEGRALQMNASAAAEAARRAAAETLSAQKAVDAWKRTNRVDDITDDAERAQKMLEMPEDLALRVQNAAETAAVLRDEFESAFTSQARAGSSAGRELRSRQMGTTAARVFKLAQQGRAYFDRLTRTAEELIGKPELTARDWTRLQKLRDILDEEGLSNEMIDAVTGGRLNVVEKEAAERLRAAKGQTGTRTKKATEREETAAEAYGRIARRRDEFRNEGDHESAQAMQRLLDDVVDRIKIEADERAVRLLDQELKDPLSPEAGMKAIQKAIGDKVVSRYNREALMAEDVRTGPGVGRESSADLSMQQWRDLDRLQKAFERRISQALQTEKNAGIRTDLRKRMSDARGVMKQALRTGDADIEDDFFMAVDDIRRIEGVGKVTGEKIAKILSDRFVDEKFAQRLRGIVRADEEIIRSRLRGIGDQLDLVMKNKTAPGAAAQVQELLQDMRQLGKTGIEASDDARERLFRTNLLEAGKGLSEVERKHLITALADFRLDDPSALQTVLKALREPSKWDKFREASYISMLSSPWTQGINALHNFGQLVGMVGLQSPLEYVASGGKLKGQGAAFAGAWNANREGRRLAGQVWRRGMSDADVGRVNQLGDVGSLRREYLTEQGGLAGGIAQWYHRFSTRPLEAVDQWLGHVAYSAKVGEAAQRKADKLLKSGDARFQGMDRVEAKQEIINNLWDHMDIIESAGRVKEYTLLKSRDKNPLENIFRTVAAYRDPGLNPTKGKLAVAVAMDYFLPFFNVPLNYAKQGLERTAGAPGYAARGGYRMLKGDVEGGASDLAKSTIAWTALGMAAGLYKADALTGRGPEDPGDRKIWLETHQPYSVRVGNQWYSYQSTPVAVPFAMIAGIGEATEEASRKAVSLGEDPATYMARLAKGAVVGAGAGFASQSFLQGLTQQVAAVFEPNFQLASTAQVVSSALTRYGSAAGVRAGLPTLSGMSNFLASMSDEMERDAGRPSTAGDLIQNIPARMAMRVPGLRQQLDERIGAYGESVRNPRSLVESKGAGIVPYYRGGTERPIDDPVSKSLQGLGVGRPPAPDSMTFEGFAIPLTIPEQHVFDREYGQVYRTILDRVEASRQRKEAETGVRPVYDEAFYTDLRDMAREMAEEKMYDVIPRDELKARIRTSMERERAAPRK